MKLHELLDIIKQEVANNPELLEYQLVVPVFARGSFKPFGLSNIELGLYEENGTYFPSSQLHKLPKNEQTSNAICIR